MISAERRGEIARMGAAAANRTMGRAEGVEARFWSYVDQAGDCWFWTGGKGLNGYGRFHRSGRMELAHRIAYELVCGSIPVDLNVLHRCDTPSCVRPEHLFLGTLSDNQRDAFVKGRNRNPVLFGERNGRSKINEETARAILEALSQPGARVTEIAKSFGVGWSTVRHIRDGNRWAHLSRLQALAEREVAK